MTAALIWLVVGIGLMVAEVLSGDFVLLMLGIGALFGAGSAALTGNPFVDVAVFAISSIGLLVLARPALKRRFLAGPGVKTNTDALVGAQAVVLSTVDPHGGQVKLAGDVWSARSFTEGQVIQPGTTVTVVEISGATAVVSAEP
ncbi:membrane protein implicated in regulation of membrane protease activity [Prauserella shujinwangii]|uniref:Membrane protein implicated in regulation of membrane protease activity n=1 Tax=Prauserella shujinwangii TaxID=1453103 RepID=A0A2T0LP20_9PSEU|nr:NfeD family protein [Prauserella shujinwangii]PRX44983.1 membrane protein implicated in regulation of membrane protease activity [Prauserella shujinwangii]